MNPEGFQRRTWNDTVLAISNAVDAVSAAIGLRSTLTAGAISRHVRQRLARPLVAWRDVGDEAIARFAERAGEFPGFSCIETEERVYPEGRLAAHVIGFVGRRDAESVGGEQFNFRDKEMCGREELRAVLLSICDTPITPELTPSDGGKIAQKTEEKIGKYELNDFFLYYTLRHGFEPSRSAAYALKAYPELDYDEVVRAAQNFYQRFFSQQFKRSCLPDGPKVGSVSLSPRGDWRMPSDASVSLWLEDLERGM